MSRHKMFDEPVERIVIKLPKTLAAFFRKQFKHGQRSVFVADSIRRFQKEHEIKQMEDDLRSVASPRHTE
jgi:metal-responsive CopG/Arc/MetJ family transcriptional regulator